MIESDTLPGLCLVAWLTAHCSPLGKLAEVCILVTGRARHRDTGILHGCGFFVTLHTLHGTVFAIKREFGFVMIKEK